MLINVHVHCINIGLSIFQELALDADEDERESVDLLTGSLLQKEAVQTPVQLSNALMKALKVGGDDRAEPASTQTKKQDNKRKPVDAVFVCICSVVNSVSTSTFWDRLPL